MNAEGMEIDHLLDRLDQLLEGAHHVPLTQKIWIDEEELQVVISELRQALPQEIRQARWIVRERERVLEDARAEAEGIVRDAKQYISRLADETTITKEANQKATEIIHKAQETARKIHQGAKQYVDDLLNGVEKGLQETHEAVISARKELNTPSK